MKAYVTKVDVTWGLVHHVTGTYATKAYVIQPMLVKFIISLKLMSFEFDVNVIRAPLFMVSNKKLEISLWCIYNIKNCQRWIKNEKVMALRSVHGQKVEKMSHPTLGNYFENTQTFFVCCSSTFRVRR